MKRLFLLFLAMIFFASGCQSGYDPRNDNTEQLPESTSEGELEADDDFFTTDGEPSIEESDAVEESSSISYEESSESNESASEDVTENIGENTYESESESTENSETAETTCDENISQEESETTDLIIIDDTEKVRLEKDNLLLPERLQDDAIVELPNCGDKFPEVIITWIITVGSDNAYISNEKLFVTNVAEEEVSIFVVATIKCGDISENMEFEIKIGGKPDVGKGELEDPFSVKEALDILRSLSVDQIYSDDKNTPIKVYVEGVITDAGSDMGYYVKKFYLGDSLEGESLYVYAADKAEAVSDIEVGDRVLISGFLVNYDGVIQMTSIVIGATKVYPMIEAVIE